MTLFLDGSLYLDKSTAGLTFNVPGGTYQFPSCPVRVQTLTPLWRRPLYSELVIGYNRRSLSTLTAAKVTPSCSPSRLSGPE